MGIENEMSFNKSLVLFREWLNGCDVSKVSEGYKAAFDAMAADDKDFYNVSFRDSIAKAFDAENLLCVVLKQKKKYSTQEKIATAIKKLRETLGSRINNQLYKSSVYDAMLLRNNDYIEFLIYQHFKSNKAVFGQLGGIALKQNLQEKDIKEEITESKLFNVQFSPLIIAFYSANFAFLDKSNSLLKKERL